MMDGEMMDGERDGNLRANIYPGLEVEIITRENRSTGVKNRGFVQEILTHASSHPHGIMVRLDNDLVGRVQTILTDQVERTSGPTLDATNVVTTDNDIEQLIQNGENERVEFKSSSLWSKNYTQDRIQDGRSWELHQFGRDASKFIIAKTIAGFLNTDGGHLIIGVKENKSQKQDEVIGIESEFYKLQDPCTDGYRRIIVDDIIRKYFLHEIYNHISDYIRISFPVLDGKTLCWLQIKRSTAKAFLKAGKTEYFFIRTDAETRQIEGKELVEYCERRYK